MAQSFLWAKILQGREKRFDIKRFGQIGHGAGLAHARDVAGHSIGAQHHHRDLPRLGVCLQAAQHLVAQDVRQVHVQQDQVGLVLAGQVQPHAALHRRQQPYPCHPAQQVLDQRQVGQVVFDVEHRPLRRASRARRLRSRGSLCRDSSPAVRLSASGSSIQNTLPWPTTLSTPIVPPMASIRRLERARPMPVPSMPVLRCPQPLEGHKEPGHLVGTQARAGIAHQQTQPLARLLCAGQRDLAPVAVVLDGVGDQVEQDLLEPLLIGQDVPCRSGRSCNLVDELNVPRRGQRTRQVQHLPHALGHVNGLDGQRHVSGFDARDIQHLVDELEQMASGFEDIADPLVVLGAEVAHLQDLARSPGWR